MKEYNVKNQKSKIPPTPRLRRTSKNQRCFLIFNLCFWSLVFGILFFTCPALHSEEEYVYDSRGRRDPFVPLLGVTFGTVGSLDDVMSIDDVNLQGIASDSTGKKAAIINGEMIKEGQTIGRVTLKKILHEKIVLMIDEEEYRVNIYDNTAEQKGG